METYEFGRLTRVHKVVLFRAALSHYADEPPKVRKFLLDLFRNVPSTIPYSGVPTMPFFYKYKVRIAEDGHVFYSRRDIATGIPARICGCCGHLFDDDEETLSVDNYDFCDEDCANEYGYHYCDQCGELSYCSVGVDGQYFCNHLCAEIYGYRFCTHCDDWVHRDYTYITHDDDVICYNCYNDHYFTCEHCDEIYHDDDYRDGVCCNCDEEYPRHLHEYGFRPETEFFGDTENSRFPYLGVELETDAGNDRYAYCEDLVEKYSDRFWLTKDGSLQDGVEVTSHPMTLQEHADSGLWEHVADCAHEYGFVSHDGGRCGLHVHINRDFFGNNTVVQNVGGYKMLRLLQRFRKQMMTFTRRTTDNWCRYTTPRDYTPKRTHAGLDICFTDLIHKSSGAASNYDHSVCVNFEHSATFELRIFRGTLKLSTFYASLAMAQGIARAAKHHGEAWIESVSWYDFADWVIQDTVNEEVRDYLRDYLVEKELICAEAIEQETPSIPNWLVENSTIETIESTESEVALCA